MPSIINVNYKGIIYNVVHTDEGDEDYFFR